MKDIFIEAPGGERFVRIWGNLGSSTSVPIVLLHDSLGTVELWRDFPASLMEATGRAVVAYDRLGFGR